MGFCIWGDMDDLNVSQVTSMYVVIFEQFLTSVAISRLHSLDLLQLLRSSRPYLKLRSPVKRKASVEIVTSV